MKKTDWDSYYNKPYKTATVTRKITGSELVNHIKKNLPQKQDLTIVELGGANSCFYELLQTNFNFKNYIIVDNNQVGLDKFKERIKDNRNVSLFNNDILNQDTSYDADIALSVGLIEHFSPQDTQKAIIAHFNAVKDDGIVVMTFPTPTFLYQITRKIAEMLNLWIFYDERPLKLNEVSSTALQYGELLDSKIIWPIFLTQTIAVFKKNLLI